MGANAIKEARRTFPGLKVEVLKLQSRIEYKLRSPSYYIIMIKVNFSISFQATTITIATVADNLSFKTLSIILKSIQTLYDDTFSFQ